MNTAGRRILFWAPRVLVILLAALVSIFALDVFSEKGGFWLKAGGLLIHLVPTFLVIAVLVVAWRWEWVGAVVFTALAAIYVIPARGRLPWVDCLVIAGPLVLAGVLFLFDWLYRAQLRKR
jgi:hypothetical protein